ncbi:MAG: hypothetical protein ACI4B3_04820 [Prevotella sp.]
MKQIQTKTSESRLSLPITSLMALLVWLLGGAIEHQLWMPFSCFVVSSYIMIELNTTFVLLRTYSRMVSCAFIVLSCCASFLFTETDSSIVSLCYVAMFMPLFNGYQDKESVGWTFYAFLAFGVASLFWVQMFFFVPVTWILMGKCLQSLSLRTFMASILGIITPYWFALVYFIYTIDYTTPMEHFLKLADFGSIATATSIGEYCTSLMALGIERQVCFGFVTTLFITGFVHNLRTKFKDKINTRMYYDVFITYGVMIILCILLQPQHFDMLFHLLIVCTSPVIAHFITHTKTFITNISFIVMTITALTIIVMNIII